jgi:uncharacterized protein (TIGR00369 family)
MKRTTNIIFSSVSKHSKSLCNTCLYKRRLSNYSSKSNSSARPAFLFLASAAAVTISSALILSHNNTAASAQDNKFSHDSIVSGAESSVASLPSLNPRVPSWVHKLASNPHFQYRDIKKAFDVSNHLLFDALGSGGKIEEYYYFTEKDVQNDNDEKNNFHYGQKNISDSENHAQNQGNDASGDHSAPPFRSPIPPPTPAHTPEVRAVFYLGDSLCGHRGITHGGLIATLMDEVSGATTFLTIKAPAFTANLNVNYLRPLPAGNYVLVRGKVVNQERRKIYVNVSVEDGRGEVYAKGTALYVKPNIDSMAVVNHATM